MLGKMCVYDKDDRVLADGEAEIDAPNRASGGEITLNVTPRRLHVYGLVGLAVSWRLFDADNHALREGTIGPWTDGTKDIYIPTSVLGDEGGYIDLKPFSFSLGL